MSNQGTCPELVSDGGRMMSMHTCGRKSKGHPEFPQLCGVHAGAILRQRQKDAARRDHRAEADARLADEQVRADAITEQFGVNLTLRTVFPTSGPGAFISRATGEVIISLADLEKLVSEVKHLKSALAEAEEMFR